MVTTYGGYRITELRRYATEYKIAGRSKMTGDELLVAVRDYWTAQRDAQQDEVLAGGPLTVGTILRHKSSGCLIRVTGETYIWEPYGAICVPAEYVELDGWAEDVQSRIDRARYANEGDARRLAQGDLPRHPIYQYERVIDMDAMHAEALSMNAAREMAIAADVQAGPGYARFVKAVFQGKSYRAAIDILHDEALSEVPQHAYFAEYPMGADELREIDPRRTMGAETLRRSGVLDNLHAEALTATVELPELTERMGLPASQQQAVAAFVDGKGPWTEDEAAELVKVWQNTNAEGVYVSPAPSLDHSLMHGERVIFRDSGKLAQVWTVFDLLGGGFVRVQRQGTNGTVRTNPVYEGKLQRVPRAAGAAVARPVPDPDSDRQRLDDLIERLCEGIPESWDGEESADWILVNYVRTIESRLLSRGGTLEQWEGDPDA